MRFQEEGREGRVTGFLYENDLVLCGEPKEDLRAIVGLIIEVCRRRGLKVNAGKSKVILLCGEEGLECEVCGNRYILSMFQNLNTWDAFFDESGADEGGYSRKVESGRRVAGIIRSLVN